MSAVSLLSSGREKSTNQSQKDGSHQEGHEEGGVGRGGGGGGDPAVLAVGPARRPITYSRDELMKLRHSPLVTNNLEHAFDGCDVLQPVLKKRSDSPNEEDRGGRGDAPNENHKGVYSVSRERGASGGGGAAGGGRCADPRERVRKESESSSGIVLSPQRRSFTSGCGAPAAAAPPAPPHVARTRPDSPLAAAPAQPPQHTNKPDGVRRIGSGRIMVRDDVREGAPRDTRWEEPAPRAEPYRPPPHQRLNGERFERRSFGRDSYSSDIKRERDDRFNNDKMRDREDNRRSGGRYSQRRFEKEDEPEWFSGGPTSKLETIELRGFDEPIKKNGNANNKETDDNAEPQKSAKPSTGPPDRKKWNNNGGSRSPAPDRWRDTSSPVAPPQHSPDTSNDKDSGVESKPEEPATGCDQPEFNLDEFLKFDSIPEVLTNGGSEAEGSRFSQWFHRESPTNDRHYERLLHNMVDDLDSTAGRQAPGGGVGGAGGEAHVFAPISPARPHPPPSLMDLLLRANEPAPEVSPGSGKIHSLEELEARLRPQHPQHPPHAPHAVPDHDLTAFKRLLAQVSGGHAVTAAAEPRTHHHQQPMTLLQMLNKSMEQQQKQQQQQQHHQQQQQQQQQPHIPQDLLYKLLQVQQRQQQQQQQNEMNAHLTPNDRDLLQRPEAQAILHGLKSGEITGTHLMQQLGNPGLQSRHREMLLTILRLHHHQRQQMGGSPLPMGGAPHLVVPPPHHQQLRLSPLPHQGGVPARIPSPRELAVHTQSIMQNALIKKKLEEQRENYNRRRQEIQHQGKQPTPISFTPTSVLRKMTAEKEADALSPKQQQWAQPPKIPQMGRPIVKGNQSGAPPMGYVAPAEYPQHYMNQQQMISGVRQFPHQPQRQQVTNSYNNMSNMGRGMPGNATLHQLLVQSHQRSLNEMANSAGAGGGDNQLARWFSPELLARASAGKLPSVHVPNALSLEDLERHHHSPAPPVRN